MKAFTAAFLVILLVLAADVGVRVGEARTCETPSNRFKGTCDNDRNCESVCQLEGFPGGECKGFRRKCICTKPCV